MTKERAQRVAQRVHEGSRGNTQVHHAAMAGPEQATWVARQLWRSSRCLLALGAALWVVCEQ